MRRPKEAQTLNGESLFQGYHGKVMLVACIGSLMGTLDSTIVSVSLPTITKDLGMDGSAALWVPAAYLVTMAVLLLTVGRYSDMYGRKKVYAAGFSLFTIGSLFCALAGDGTQLVACRIFQGIGGAFITATSAAIITNSMPPAIRGRALGFFTMSVYAGLSLGPPLGGFLTDSFGWRSIFLLNLPIGIVVVTLALIWLKEGALPEMRKRFDIAGAVAFSVVLVALMVALTLVGRQGWEDPLPFALLGVAVAGFPIFVTIERRRGSWAMFDLSLVLRNRLFAAANLSALLNYLAYFNISFMLSFYLQRVLEFSIVTTGFILLALPVTMTVVAPISGMWSDRLGSRTLATSGMVLVAMSMLAMTTFGLHTEIWHLLLLLSLLGMGMGLFSSPNTSAVMGCVRRDQLGVASGTVSLMRTVGMSLSLVVMGLAISVFGSPEVMAALGNGGSGSLDPQQFLDGMRASLIISSIIALVGAGTSSMRPKGCGPMESNNP